MGYFKLYCLQTLVENQWVNYEICRTIKRAIEFVNDELPGQKIRILGYNASHEWVEILISGNMLPIGNNPRMLSLVGF